MTIWMRRILPVAAVAIAVGAQAADSAFAPALFWWWNSKLDAAALNAQVDAFSRQGARSLCIHPFPKGWRPNRFPCDMSPDYLTDGYLKVYSAVTDHAARLGMKCWLYDEGGWPSGGACGQVLASDPDRFARRWMQLVDGKPSVVVERHDPAEGAGYPSVIEPGVTGRFLALTHERLKGAIGRHFGTSVPWAFTDEPQMPCGYRYAWTSDFEAEFRRRKGYDISPHLPQMLARGPSDEKTKGVRIDYWDVLSRLFVERYLLPVRDWCRANRLQSGGHLDGDDGLLRTVTHGHGHALRALRAMDIPGVDAIWRQIHPDAAYSPYPRYASSAAHQIGAKRVLSESFAIYGETLSPDVMKYVVDFQMVRGVNQFVFAFASSSTAGNFMSLGDPHWGACDPKWNYVKPFMDYVTASCERLAQGRPDVQVGVYYDVKAVWASSFTEDDEGRRAAAAQTEVAHGLETRQVDFDFVDDDLIEEGRLPYRALVFPTCARLSETARSRLKAFKAKGGLVLRPDQLDRAPRTCRVEGPGHEAIRVTKRILDDGAVDYFLVNESAQAAAVCVTFAEGACRTVAFDPHGSEFVRISSSGEAQMRPPRSVPRGAKTVLSDGWTVRPTWRVKPGASDFDCVETPSEPPRACRLGDWGPYLGTNFSGRATYRISFVSEAGAAELDLGRVALCAAAKLNGQALPAKFFGPFRWDVTLVAGENVLEVEVGNSLANALIPELDRIGRDFPPPSSYTARERAFYAKDDLSSGLFGPVAVTRQSVSSAVASPYGCVAHIPGWLNDERMLTAEFAAMKAAGMRWVRYDVEPRKLKGSDGAMDFTFHDRLLAAVERAGLQVLPILYGPDSATEKPADMERYRDYIQKFVRHYGRRFPVVEIWNEANVGRFFKGTDPKDYAETLTVAHAAVKSVDPGVRVAFTGTSHVPLAWIREVFAAGATNAFDIMNVHPYAHPWTPEGHVDVELEGLKALMAEFGIGDKPIWITELGYPTTLPTFHDIDVLLGGLKVAQPEKKSWRVILADLKVDGAAPEQAEAEALEALLPPGSVVRACTQRETVRALEAGDADVVVYPPTECYPAETEDAVRRFVERGGVLAQFGGAPCWKGYRGREPVPGRMNGEFARTWPFGVRAYWSKDAAYPQTLAVRPTEAVRGVSSAARAADTGQSAHATGIGSSDVRLASRYFVSERLPEGGAFVPLLTGTAADGREVAGAAVVTLGPGKGAIVVCGVRPKGCPVAISEETQAKWTTRGLALCFAEGVEAYFCYELRSTETEPFYSERHFGLTHADLTPKPAYSAYSAFTKLRPAGSVQTAGAWHDDARRLYWPGWTRPDGKRAGLVWTTGDAAWTTLRFAGGVPELRTHLGRTLAPVRVGPGTYRVKLSDAPLYWLGAELVAVGDRTIK